MLKFSQVRIVETPVKSKKVELMETPVKSQKQESLPTDVHQRIQHKLDHGLDFTKAEVEYLVEAGEVYAPDEVEAGEVYAPDEVLELCKKYAQRVGPEVLTRGLCARRSASSKNWRRTCVFPRMKRISLISYGKSHRMGTAPRATTVLASCAPTISIWRPQQRV